jgi:multiple sugar transport system permease protein
MTRPATTRFVVYGLLFTLGTLFATPFVWLVLTALKPVEQTTKFPPVFIPRAYHAALDGRSVEVTKDYILTQDAVIVEAAGLRHVVSLAHFDEAASTVRLSPDTPPVGARLLKRVQAGDWRVTERAEGFGRASSLAWDIVPESAIDARVKPRWENFALAVATIDDRSVEEVQGTVSTVPSHGADSDVTFWDFLTNTLLVCVLGTAGAVFSNALIAYGFARLKWSGRDLLFALTLGTMMVPFPVLMVPLYGVFKELGWIGTLLPLWVPAWFGSAFNIFLMRQFFRTIPEDLSEAARIDGCSEWQIFWRVILPLSKPVLAVVALFHFLHAWNDFMGPLLYLTKRSTFTLAVALQNYQTQNGGTPWHFLMAASTIVIVPVILLFFFTQKTFIRGIATTGMKG